MEIDSQTKASLLGRPLLRNPQSRKPSGRRLDMAIDVQPSAMSCWPICGLQSESHRSQNMAKKWTHNLFVKKSLPMNLSHVNAKEYFADYHHCYYDFNDNPEMNSIAIGLRNCVQHRQIGV